MRVCREYFDLVRTVATPVETSCCYSIHTPVHPTTSHGTIRVRRLFLPVVAVAVL